MMDRITITNFRGIQHLEVANLGRFNLVIGGNGSGKTSLLAAAAFAADPANWPGTFLQFLDDIRPTYEADFDRHIVPLCFGGNTSILPEVRWSDGEEHGAQLVPHRTHKIAGFTVIDLISTEVLVAVTERERKWVPNSPPPPASSMWWSPAFVESEATIANALIQSYKAGRMSEVVRGVQRVNTSVVAVEPVGNDIYVRLNGHPLPMRYSILGDGARRILEFAVALALDSKALFIDELENGFHHRTLPVVLDMLRHASCQLFATTHREELLRVACEHFIASGDDGLRIVRIDRDGDAHRAVVYTAAEALAGLDTDLELRG